ncbi:site-specific integrase [Pseudonocardia sp. RS11V-5]|uniref:tyrosine-type recombinase/integrase n=1 Tax=Pseudonocardia terrae TaxID=2905831 RepID=UPI001E39AFA7|nr:site-specific integrase [Pseudonocardia terrae]MCE3551273.1 site-specific integrase [Pseudonocardia terrae]
MFSHGEYGEEAGKLAEAIIKRGRALPVIAVFATQRPDSKSLPTGVSTNVGVWFCLRVMERAIRTGSGPRRSRMGVGDESTVVRPDYVDTVAAEKVAARARAARERAGTPRVEQDRIVPLTVDQVDAIVDVIGDRYKAMVVAQAGLGLRIGELLALRVEDVDFLRRTARVEHQIDRITRERVAPKTPRSRRTLPLPDVVAVALSQHIAEHPPAVNGTLFHTRDGMPIMHDWYGNKVFTAAAVKAGLPDSTTSHDLRHHYASVLLASGQSVVAVAELLGHENASLVLSTYGHLLPGSEDVARRAIDAAWNTAREPAEQASAAQGRPE